MAEIERVEARVVETHLKVMVVEVCARTLLKLPGSHRQSPLVFMCGDAREVKSGVEVGSARRHILVAVVAHGADNFRIFMLVRGGDPCEEGDMKLIERGTRRSVKKKVSVVVEDIFAVVGGVKERRPCVGLFKRGDHPVKEIVGHKYCIVISVDERLPVAGGNFLGMVGKELAVPVVVAVGVVEVASVAVNHYQLPVCRCL